MKYADMKAQEAARVHGIDGVLMNNSFYALYIQYKAVVNRRYDMRRHAGVVFHKLTVH